MMFDILVLGGVLNDSPATRVVVFAGLVLMIVVLLFRIWVDVLNATKE